MDAFIVVYTVEWLEPDLIDIIPAVMSSKSSSLSLLHNGPLGSFCPWIRGNEGALRERQRARNIFCLQFCTVCWSCFSFESMLQKFQNQNIRSGSRQCPALCWIKLVFCQMTFLSSNISAGFWTLILRTEVTFCPTKCRFVTVEAPKTLGQCRWN